MNGKVFHFKVILGDGRCAGGYYTVTAQTAEEATDKALYEIGKELYNALPGLDIEITVELVEV